MVEFGKDPYSIGVYGGTIGEEADSSFDLPKIFPLHDESTDFYWWLEAHRDSIRRLRNHSGIVQRSLQVDNATGNSLDLIGAEFGILGKRRGRTDQEYQIYLTNLVDAFGGRGREKDVEFAVASGLAIDRSNVEVSSDFANNEYDLVISNWPDHTTGGAIERLADLTDPAAIPLQKVILQTENGTTSFTADDTIDTDLGYGLSADDLGDLSSGTWNLSDSTP